MKFAPGQKLLYDGQLVTYVERKNRRIHVVRDAYDFRLEARARQLRPLAQLQLAAV